MSRKEGTGPNARLCACCHQASRASPGRVTAPIRIVRPEMPQQRPKLSCSHRSPLVCEGALPSPVHLTRSNRQPIHRRSIGYSNSCVDSSGCSMYTLQTHRTASSASADREAVPTPRSHRPVAPTRPGRQGEPVDGDREMVTGWDAQRRIRFGCAPGCPGRPAPGTTPLSSW